MDSMFTAESAILFELDPIGIVLFVLESIVVPLLAFGAGKSNFYAHNEPPCSLPAVLQYRESNITKLQAK